ncbi:M28 family metallopeptidase [Marinifilum caeruleilacunae]|uniref:M28 family peptidase n=1 Tax=Marinifilum caeruleilacunae TaxID=2499076 RepID=A0ABX1WRH3_9BACT|nr:M28 family peptidase [Marinifilum caeruleilacunae]NOU58606.1 M28 family peptidase [Marinifilum caeruleilacunae]
MKKLSILSFCLLISIKLLAQEIDLIDLSHNISLENIKKDVYELASEKMEGRETGEKGQKLAAEYIYKQFKNAGLLSYQKRTDSLSYFQEFSVFKEQVPQVSLSVNGNKLKPFDDFFLLGVKDLKKENIELVFLGLAPDSVYQNQDFSNRAVLFLTSNLFAGPSKAMDIMKETKTSIVFYCNPENPHQMPAIVNRQKRLYNRRQLLDPKLFPFKNPYDSLTHKKFYHNVERMISTYQGPISEKATAKILELKPKDLKKHLNGKLAKSQEKQDVKIDLEFRNIYKSKPTENVIASIPGTDLKDEYIVLSAHYDHIGKRGNKIFYGANDNASGTAALMEIARSIQNAVNQGLKLKRSILFVAFTGEEKGLLGSKYFVESNTFPHQKIKANLNIDMLGRMDELHDTTNFVYLLGANDLNPKLKLITDSLNQLYPKLELDYSYDTKDNFLYAASDQASFVKRNIPAIFYFNGLHNDYHKTSDTPEKMDFEAIKKVSSLILLTAIELANQE